ncbi:LLM class F420-dependent oxidoreductase [Mycobacteroides immunogenum]|uniref:N5,N10-methylene tetrahydromethanopterin reductase n=1 Tax=Mycobacteroides immunogenum TaxID=83262 RepID=A0A7V8RXN9_9MYCO|nr:LLM class F420-dependent oxidoreductase [Mycobacteroides immunogenum]AMT70343.1 N5,N10-methylene tetrahydromethanopterin reductase [Mycobacteroides immunogenum]ANO03408.1 LLM class F420-dependent oxidoreductase [Mycobacteroides immunogenum]KIU42124.1 N5,N10-methylene tetrahydromethanopterin reductase [Mycobacteroides immunogenum]KPG13431.1 N5,N10-methylene tetrahydromethanopterin reductase [Mycobacteroides immunogenum]KPG14651.1 N5,N10-methylene tetrahydromethanopterin reductase [Mycobacter
MRIGIFTAITDEGMAPGELAVEIEERGFESLFVPEHTHIPVTIEAIHAGWDEIPRDYCRSLDPFVALSFAAAATRDLRIGTAVALLVQRDPITFAKETASLDRASGGRLELGIGVGWLREEIRNHGTDPRTRVALQSERIHAVKKIWTQEQAEVHGKYVAFDPILSWPKPAQQPHPPVWLGGWGPSTHERVLDHADGWMAPTMLGVEELRKGIDELNVLAAKQGRPRVPVTATILEPQPGDIERRADLGVHRVLLGLLPVASRDTTLRKLDRLAALGV